MWLNFILIHIVPIGGGTSLCALQPHANTKYMYASTTAQEAIWLRKLLVGLFGQIPGPTVIHCDNQSCIQMSMNLVFHDKMKHIEIQYHYICDMV